MQPLNALKDTLQKELGQTWARQIARECLCSAELVRAIFREELPDRKGIIGVALELLKKRHEQTDALKKRLDNIVNQHKTFAQH
jgi:hypothetical protein